MLPCDSRYLVRCFDRVSVMASYQAARQQIMCPGQRSDQLIELVETFDQGNVELKARIAD
ncbi:hypothetical protein BDB13_6353 [Rhodococcus sp. OK302]|nr:hypothetical protein BDB13_6353 [Rhodococcus sp. OK302]